MHLLFRDQSVLVMELVYEKSAVLYRAALFGFNYKPSLCAKKEILQTTIDY
jgi:hypothetical protein